MREYKFKWCDNKVYRDHYAIGSYDTTDELIILANGKKDAIIKAMNIVKRECIFTEWNDEFLENAYNLSLQELREFLHKIDISKGSAFIYWIVELETDESVFESGYEDFDDEDNNWNKDFDAGCEDEYFDEDFKELGMSEYGVIKFTKDIPFKLGYIVSFRSKDKSRYSERICTGIDHTPEAMVLKIFLGNESYTPQELFDNFEFEDRCLGWIPFGCRIKKEK